VLGPTVHPRLVAREPQAGERAVGSISLVGRTQWAVVVAGVAEVAALLHHWAGREQRGRLEIGEDDGYSNPRKIFQKWHTAKRCPSS